MEGVNRLIERISKGNNADFYICSFDELNGILMA
jgi:hypothetical protein